MPRDVDVNLFILQVVINGHAHCGCNVGTSVDDDVIKRDVLWNTWDEHDRVIPCSYRC